VELEEHFIENEATASEFKENNPNGYDTVE
jgi:hypothetical protein